MTPDDYAQRERAWWEHRRLTAHETGRRIWEFGRSYVVVWSLREWQYGEKKASLKAEVKKAKIA